MLLIYPCPSLVLTSSPFLLHDLLVLILSFLLFEYAPPTHLAGTCGERDETSFPHQMRLPTSPTWRI